MRSVRMMLMGLAASAAIIGGGACDSSGLALTSAAASGVWVEVRPSSVQAGFSVTVRASCADNSNEAMVSSKAFRTLTLQPTNSVLEGQATVPQTVKAGTFDVRLECRTGSTAVTTLTVIGSATQPPTQPPATVGPHTGGGFLANSNGSDTGSAIKQSDSARMWLVGGFTALVAAGAVAVASVRRRRRAPARVR